MRQIEDRFLWEQLSIFLSFRHISKWSWGVSDAKTDHFSCEFICIGVCWCTLLALNHVQVWSVVTVVPELQVSPSTFSPNTHLLSPGKCFQPELGYREAAQTSEQRQECPSPSKGSIWPFLYPQLNTQQLEGRKGASVRKRLGNDGREGRSWAEILAPARASSAANATILTQKMMTATSSLYNVNKSFSHRPMVIHRLLTYIFVCVFNTYCW